MKTELRPYSGPHAGRLYHVVDSDTGAVIRNATPLEVELWEKLQKGKNLAEVRAEAVIDFCLWMCECPRMVLKRHLKSKAMEFCRMIRGREK